VLDNIVLAGNYCKIKGILLVFNNNSWSKQRVTGFKARLEKDIKRFLCQTDFANEIQPKDIKFGRMPEFIEALKGRTQDASWLGAAIVAKVH
jgi:actin-related protein